MKSNQILGKRVPRKTAVSRALAAMAGALLLSAAAYAETGGLRIAVTGSDGKPLSGVTVKISSPSSLVTKVAATEADGTVRVSGLDPAGDYVVEVTASGFQKFTSDKVAVVGGQSVSLGYALTSGNLDTVLVTGSRLAAMDTTSATVGTVLTLDIVDSLPTGRSYTSYLQLVPGVKPSSTGNPSSKSGVNYADTGATGNSTDNVYILDGVDVTDHNTGTFGSNFNSEIIQEQRVLTGGIPAEYAGGSGLLSIVTTKSGSDTFSGSVNYYFQNDSLVAKNQHATTSGFNSYDTAVTLGGPIIPGKLWFFGSYQIKDSVTKLNDTDGNYMRDVASNSKLGFLKTTWQVTPEDRMVATYFNDPQTVSGSSSSTTLNNRDRAPKYGGDNYKLEYTHDADDWRFNAYAFKHSDMVSLAPADYSTRNDIVYFDASPAATISDLSKGGYGVAYTINKDREEVGFSFEKYFGSSKSTGTHALKTGFSTTSNIYKDDTSTTGSLASNNARYSSLAAANSGLTIDDWVTDGVKWVGAKSFADSDIHNAVDAINGMTNAADKAYVLGLLDTDHDGSVSDAELYAYPLTDKTGNPNGAVNVYRILEVLRAPYNVKSTGRTLYLQDTWTLDKLSLTAGVRGEEWTHFDSKGSQTAKFEWNFAPRLSAVFDINGDGRSKVWGFAGRYYDPVRTNMSDFAGAITGQQQDEQIKIGDKWVTYQTRGGEKTPDALFAPTTKTPYTDEIMLGYAFNVGKEYTYSVAYTKRETRDLIEDYDLAIYSDPDQTAAYYPKPNSAAYLPYSYFGYSIKPNSNYVIGTLAGGKRDYQGIELSVTKQRSDNWQGGGSYTWNEAMGNSNSDSNADLQGDVFWLDPRAPNQYGPQPGNISHQLKAWGTYYLDNGFEFSGVFNWNSGLIYSKAFELYGRTLPVRDSVASTWETARTRFLEAGAVGGYKAPSYYTLDVRFKYKQDLGGNQKAEYFLDVFNILDQQFATGQMTLAAGNGAYTFRQDNAWLSPRRFYLGARYSF